MRNREEGSWKKEIVKIIKRILLDSVVQGTSSFVTKKVTKSLEEKEKAQQEKKKQRRSEKKAVEPVGKKHKSPDASTEPQEAPEAVTGEEVAEEAPVAE